MQEGDKVRSNGKYRDIQEKFGDTVHTVVAVGTIPSCKKPMVWLDCGGGGFMADGFDVVESRAEQPRQTLGEPDETLPDIVAWIHRHADVYGHDLAERIDRASVREREMWRQRVADAMQIADQFKETLSNVLNGLLYAQHREAGHGK